MVDSAYTGVAEKLPKVGPVKVYASAGFARAHLFHLDQQTPVTGSRGDLNGVYYAKFIGKNAREPGFVYAAKRRSKTKDGNVVYKPEGKFYLIGERVAEKPKTRRRQRAYVIPDVAITELDGTVTRMRMPQDRLRPFAPARPRAFDETYLSEIDAFLAAERPPQPFDQTYDDEIEAYLRRQGSP